MRRIIFGILSIVAVVALVSAVTLSQFKETETSDNNTIATGTIDLKVDGQDDPNVAHITLNNLKPGDGVGGAEHSTIQYYFTLSNTGSVAGKPWVQFTNLVNNDNGCNEPESEVDTTCGDPGEGEGELGANLMMKLNAPGATGFVYLNQPGCSDFGSQCSLDQWAGTGVLGLTGEVWEQIPAGGSTAPMVLEIELPVTTGNEVQSDSVEFDIVFGLEQI